MDFKGQMFFVVSGDCTVDDDGCVSSPGYLEGVYNNNDRCRIAVNGQLAKPLRVENFSTEDGTGGAGVICTTDGLDDPVRCLQELCPENVKVL